MHARCCLLIADPYFGVTSAGNNHVNTHLFILFFIVSEASALKIIKSSLYYMDTYSLLILFALELKFYVKTNTRLGNQAS